MKRIAVLAAIAALVVVARAGAAREDPGPAEVRGVSVLPANGKVAVVVSLRGTVEVRDFTLSNPARLVLDVVGARLHSVGDAYDGAKRGGVKNVRCAQFQPDVVRVVVDLDALHDYQVIRGDSEVRVEFSTDGPVSFASWSSEAPAPVPASAPVAATLPAAAAAPSDSVLPLGSLALAPQGGLEDAAAASSDADVDAQGGIARYLATHAHAGAASEVPRITVRWDGADIEDVVAGFAAFSGRTIVVAKDVKGTVTAEVKNQPWDLAFAAVLESQGLTYQVLDGGIINVLNKADFAKADSTVPVETRLVRVNYAKVTALLPAVQSIVSKGRGSVVADTSHNSLVITDTKNRINDIEQFVQGLDVRTPQVSIQAKIIFVDRTVIENMGVQYDLGSQTQFFNTLVQRPIPSSAQPGNNNANGVPTGTVPTQFYSPSQTVIDIGGNSLSATGNANQAVINPALNLIFSTALGNFTLTSFLQALHSLSLDDIQAEPVITTLDNRPAQILVGNRVPIRVIDVGSASNGSSTPPVATVDFEQTGINLKVTPHVTARRQILMEVHAERSNVVPASVDIGFTFQTQQADNQVLVGDGETAVIGGLTVTEVTESKTGIPLLVDLPFIGKIFSFTNQEEDRQDLLILITPHIVDDLVAPSGGN
ncbi:MAG TPA: AMIN domain-containing protein [Gemmatimonadales bacterium]|nr:AMIN domain-containing protein [Gemmatimonadales bacterium]